MRRSYHYANRYNWLLNTLRVLGAITFIVPVTALAVPKEETSMTGFKEILLGTSFQSISNTRLLRCQEASKRARREGAHSSPSAERLQDEAWKLSSLAFSGDRNCTVRKPDTIGGMKISEIRLIFFKDTLSRIEIGIINIGITKPNYRGGGVWSSDDLFTLIRTMDSRFGAHQEHKQLDCSRGIGGCRAAPYKKTLKWFPNEDLVTLTYRESTVGERPMLVFVSKKFKIQQEELWEKARQVSQQAVEIERAAAEKKKNARVNDF